MVVVFPSLGLDKIILRNEKEESYKRIYLSEL
jgi:hypothetical protein